MSTYARVRVALALFVVVMTGAAWGLGESQRNSVAAADAHLRTSGGMLTAMLDQETGLRGFDQTGSEEFLEPYRDGRAAFERRLSDAYRHTPPDDVRVLQLIAAQAGAARAWQDHAQLGIAKVRRDGRRSASSAEARERKALMDRFRVANAEYGAHVETRAAASWRRFRWMASVGVLAFGIVLLGIGFFAVDRQARRDRRRRAREQEFIETLQGAQDEQEAQDVLRRHVERDVQGADALVLETSNSATRLRASTSVAALPEVAERLRHAEPRMCLALRRGRAYEREDGGDPLQACEICGDRAGTTVCQPSVVGGAVIGSLLVTRRKRMRLAERRSIARAVSQAAPVLANLRNLAVAERRAATDALTGLPNHRSMQEAVTRLAAGAARTAEPLAAVVLDVDHFKALNDRHGHRAGDEVLASIAATLRAHVREADFAGRWGGEEFLLLLPGTDADGGVEVADKIRAALESVVVPGVPARVTGSLGVAAFPLHATAGEALVRAADHAMYEAKRAGRNRVAVAPEPVIQLPAA